MELKRSERIAIGEEETLRKNEDEQEGEGNNKERDGENSNK